MSKEELDKIGKRSIQDEEKLLIGAFLEINPACNYTLDNFEIDYHSSMVSIGTSDSSWRPDTRTMGIGFAQYGAVNVSATQKLFLGVTYKDQIWNMMHLTPTEANPCFLMHRLGVEMSNYTGHARRLRLIDLFRIERIQRYLHIRCRNWQTTPWGQRLLSW
jgi:hypothetical protein